MTEQDRRDGHAKSVDHIDTAPKATGGPSTAATVVATVRPAAPAMAATSSVLI